MQTIAHEVLPYMIFGDYFFVLLRNTKNNHQFHYA
jgi:hypothetical protein